MLLTEFCVNIVQGLFFCYLFSLLMIYKSTSTAFAPLFRQNLILILGAHRRYGYDVGERRRKKRDKCGWREKKQCQFMWLIFNPWIVYLTHIIHLY